MNPFLVVFQLLSRRGAEAAFSTIQRAARVRGCNVFQQVASGRPCLPTVGAEVLHTEVNRLFVHPDRLLARLVWFVVADVTLHRGLLQVAIVPTFIVNKIQAHFRLNLEVDSSSSVEVIHVCLLGWVNTWIHSRIAHVKDGRFLEAVLNERSRIFQHWDLKIALVGCPNVSTHAEAPR